MNEDIRVVGLESFKINNLQGMNEKLYMKILHKYYDACIWKPNPQKTILFVILH